MPRLATIFLPAPLALLTVAGIRRRTPAGSTNPAIAGHGAGSSHCCIVRKMMTATPIRSVTESEQIFLIVLLLDACRTGALSMPAVTVHLLV